MLDGVGVPRALAHQGSRKTHHALTDGLYTQLQSEQIESLGRGLLTFVPESTDKRAL